MGRKLGLLLVGREVCEKKAVNAKCPSELQWEPVGSGCSSVNMFEENIHSTEDRKYTEQLVCPDSGNHSPVFPRKSAQTSGDSVHRRATFQEVPFCLGGEVESYQSLRSIARFTLTLLQGSVLAPILWHIYA